MSRPLLTFVVVATLASADGMNVYADRLATEPGPLAEPKANRAAPPRERFREARSFYTYYGSGKVAELSHYDVAIMHTPMMKAADVKRLSTLGVVTLGYLTIGEDHALQPGNGAGPGGKASWYFDQDRDGRADRDPIWKSWYANTSDPLWRADRVAAARRLIEDYGFDGVFLDLISVSELYPESRDGMVQMIAVLREAFPQAVIVMNQGFDVVADAASLADGFMMESFTSTYDFEAKKYTLHSPTSLDFHLGRTAKVLDPAIDGSGMRVLVLDYAAPDDRAAMQLAANRAASLGYLHSVSPILLDGVYADIPAGEADAKWLKLRATPDLLATTLGESRNGFPPGTVISPSGCYAGYEVAPVVDPSTDRSTFPWSKAAWASAEDGDPAWIEFGFPAERKGGELAIVWHDAAGPSREFKIQVRESDAAPWRDVESVSNNRLQATKHQLPTIGYRQLRVLQPPTGGSPGRPNIMWITRVELRD